MKHIVEWVVICWMVVVRLVVDGPVVDGCVVVVWPVVVVAMVVVVEPGEPDDVLLAPLVPVPSVVPLLHPGTVPSAAAAAVARRSIRRPDRTP